MDKFTNKKRHTEFPQFRLLFFIMPYATSPTTIQENIRKTGRNLRDIGTKKFSTNDNFAITNKAKTAVTIMS